MLDERVNRVKLKGKGFSTFSPASDEEVVMFESEINQIDPEIIIGLYQQTHLKKADKYKKFLEQHCIERQYFFQIKRCSNEDCCIKPYKDRPWVPDPVYMDPNGLHYKKLADVIGTNTTEKDCPSTQKQTVTAVAEEQQGCKNSVLVGQNVRMTMDCTECSKPRCIYSKVKLTPREVRNLKLLLQSHDYSCGAVITTDGHILQGKVFVKLQINCQSPVEFAYYSSGIGKPDICCHRKTEGVEIDKDLKKQFRIVLPVCQACLSKKKPILKRNPIKN